MAQIFHAGHNSIARWSLPILLVLVTGSLVAWDALHKSPYVRYTKVPLNQPVAFSHKHHTNMGIDCRYCHTTVEKAPSAGLPPTETCLACHSQVWNKSPLLDAVRASWFTGTAIPWTRVHKLPDFVYFNHAIHVNKGIGCADCHGRVDQMAVVEQAQPLNMGWCLECHRNPVPNLRPLDQITNMKWQPPANQAEVGARLAKQYDVRARVSCTTCHR